MMRYGEAAPRILADLAAAEEFVRSLERPLDLLEAACSGAALATLALDVHLEREGKDNHVEALIGTAYWLQRRLVAVVDVWRSLDE